MNVTKAIIPVAGLGTRMLPATKSIPKEMLPVFDKPLIQYVIEEAISAGIKEIVLVSREGKSAITEHFNKDFELEAILEKKGKYGLLSTIKSNSSKKIVLKSVIQHQANGLGDAILCAKSVIGAEPFAVLLPDVLIDEYYYSRFKDNLAAMIRNFNSTRHSQVMVEKIPTEQTDRYGIVDCHGNYLLPGKNQRISRIVEKPRKGTAPSNLAVVGRYVFDATIWPCLEKVKPDRMDEIQLTDAIALLIQQQTVDAYCIVGRSHDCGNKLGYAMANLEYALRDQHIGALLDRHIKDDVMFRHNYALAANA